MSHKGVQDRSLADNVVTNSRDKLDAVAEALTPFVPTANIQTRPCQTVEEACNYRCKCGFQIIADNKGDVQYALRENQHPVVLVDGHFPVATASIQRAMKAFQQSIRSRKLRNITRNLASAIFSCSWNNVIVMLTLNYDSAMEDEIGWKDEARRLCNDLGLFQLTGRSKGCVLRAVDNHDNCISDTIWIYPKEDWKVKVAEPDASVDTIAVHYLKPEGAFFHPNMKAMQNALQWTLQRLSLINTDLCRKNRLLELYCGLGAHTVPIAKSGLVEKILAVELDQRLASACEKNCFLNDVESLVRVIREDAGKWACGKSNEILSFDTLLVDPPRDGLDKMVCNMAIHGSFQHLLYISCGKDALVRDLALLDGSFYVEKCVLLDLFPTFDSVESLVHLRRKQRI